MPRKAKKPPVAPYPTGAPKPQPQSPHAPTGMPYGAHQDTLAAQAALPVAGGAAAPAPVGDSAVPAPPPAATDADILGAAAAHNFQPVDLTAPPDSTEPLSAGLPLGPGAGPGAIAVAPNTADTLQLLAQTTGDPLFLRLAEQATLRASAGRAPITPTAGLPQPSVGPTPPPALAMPELAPPGMPPQPGPPVAMPPPEATEPLAGELPPATDEPEPMPPLPPEQA